MHDVILQNDVMTLWHSQNIFFQWIFSLFFVFAPTASILNRFPQTRYHFKAENLLFPTMYKSWWFAMICMCKSYESMRISMNPYANHDLYMVGKRRFSALKWYLVCENQLRIESYRSNIHTKFTPIFNERIRVKPYVKNVNENHVARINKNQSESILQESMRIRVPDLFKNQWRINSRLIWESARITKNHWESMQESGLRHHSRVNENQVPDLFENHQESVRIRVPDLFENHQESIPDVFKNHWELVRIINNQWESGFRLIQDINENQFQNQFQNHWELARIIENHVRIIQNQLRINENQGLDLFENQWESIPDLFENHRELARISKNQGLDSFENQGLESIPDLFENQFKNQWRIIKNWQESLRIGENQGLDLFEISMRINSRLIQESLRIGKNHWESSRISENQWESGFRLIWESMKINSRLIWESLRIGENHQESMRIITNWQESLRIRV